MEILTRTKPEDKSFKTRRENRKLSLRKGNWNRGLWWAARALQWNNPLPHPLTLLNVLTRVQLLKQLLRRRASASERGRRFSWTENSVWTPIPRLTSGICSRFSHKKDERRRSRNVISVLRNTTYSIITKINCAGKTNCLIFLVSENDWKHSLPSTENSSTYEYTRVCKLGRASTDAFTA